MQEEKSAGRGILGAENQITLTSHERGWHDDSQRGRNRKSLAARDEKPVGQHIEALIQRVKKESTLGKHERQRALEARREHALAVIGEAGGRFFDLTREEDMEILRARLICASAARISEAEAMAEMAADHGDFTSPLVWWEIGQEGNVLWKGYVLGRRVGMRADARFVRNRVARVKLDDGLDLVTCQTALRGYVTEAHHPRGVVVGISHFDDGETDEEAKRLSISRAYLAYHALVMGKEIEICDVPEEIFEGLDYQGEDEYNEE